jgi:hypothetical protein
VPDPAPFKACIAQLGMQVCPSGFPTQHFVGTQIADTRGCTACGCGFDAGACVGSTTFYTGAGCAGGPTTTAPVTGTCTGAKNHTYTNYAYTEATTASCTATAASPLGGVVFSDLTTVCCQ